ncbi:MAG TPA: hypothetical protein VE913_18855, partial [Longimicrobium sp.]|nr:hypothetical protein [Longimicrobium sp.]
MKRFVLCALLAVTAGLAGCDGSSPTATAPAQPVTMMEQPIDRLDREPCIDICEPGDTTTYPPYVPPTYEYRIV